MKTSLARLLTTVALFFTLSSVLHADITVSVSFSDTTPVASSMIAEGTNSVDLFLFFEGTGSDAGSSFDGFTYAIEATNTGGATAPTFSKPIGTSNLQSTLFTDGWGVVDQSNTLAGNQIGGNVNAPAGSGLSAGLDVAPLSFTLDTSGLVSGDTIEFDANFVDFAAVSFQGSEFELDFRTSSLTVTAVPEPSGIVILPALACLLLRRNRKHFAW
jgi:hypothetical protein